MKRIALYSYLLLMAVSCSLNEEISGFATRESSYNSFSQAQAAVNNCYRYTSFITTNFGLMTEACTDIWYCNTSTVDANLAISPSSPGVGTAVWNNCYTAIASCNEAIECITNRSKLSEAERNVLQAEARSLRALYYYFLTNTFDGVPFYLYMVENREVQDKIQGLPRTPAKEIRAALYDDLKENALPYFTKENGLKARPCDVKENRAGYALSLMLMAKFAMWNGEWNKAIEPLEELEELYGSLASPEYSLENTLWSVKNSPESIFEIQHAWSATGVQYTSSYGRLTLPKYNGEGVFDGIHMPELGTNLSDWASSRATYHYASFRGAKQQEGETPRKTSDAMFVDTIFGDLPMSFGEYLPSEVRYSGVVDPSKLSSCDLRIQYAVGLGRFPTSETFDQVHRGLSAYAGGKLWCYNMTSAYDSNNYKIFRYSDALLMLAECYAMKSNFTKACKYLNCTRTRAGLDMFTTSDLGAFMSELRNERARELGGELHRKYDLVRWGIWYDETYKYTSNSTLKANMRTYHEYYPIPDTECALSGYILTNDAYHEN